MFSSLVIALTAGVLAGYFVNLLRQNRSFHRDAVRGTALVTGKRLHEDTTVDGKPQRYHSLTLRFTAMDGRTVTTGVDAYGIRSPKEGRETGIRYDPRNPRDVRLDTLLGRGTCWQVPATLVCIAMSVIAFAGFVHALLAK